MRVRLMTVFAAGLIIFGLTGCGENKIPEMTDEQMQLIGEYTAVTLMKYDANQRSRLVDYTEMLATPEPEIPQEPEAEEPQGMDPTDDTPVVDGPAADEPAAPMSIEEALKLPEGIGVIYTGEGLYDSYPEGEDTFFALSASEGKKLLVLNFSIINASGQEQSVDILSLSPEFKVSVNGEYSRRALMTWLEEDLTVYQGTLPSMGSAATVLVIEVDEETASDISSLSISLKNDSETYTIPIL